jgi:predicted nucleotidyltransferase
VANSIFIEKIKERFMNYKIYSVAEIKKRFEKVADKYGIDEAYLFGSYARGEATKKSDVDIFVKEGKINTLLQLCGFRLALSDVLKKEVDIIVNDSGNPALEKSISKDFLKIYG